VTTFIYNRIHYQNFNSVLYQLYIYSILIQI
jgi:hypothetical protein